MRPCFTHDWSAVSRFIVVKQLRIANVQIARLFAACLHWAREFYDWYQRPSTTELRGRKLLREWLSSEQLAQYDAHNYFEVTGCYTGKRYRINHGVGMNIYELDHAGRPQAGWCFVPSADLVAGDVMLAQKIALETDELGALAVGRNFTIRYRPG
jgi:hypothetical protein